MEKSATQEKTPAACILPDLHPLIPSCAFIFLQNVTQNSRSCPLISVEESEQKHQLTAQVCPEVWHSPCLLRT